MYLYKRLAAASLALSLTVPATAGVYGDALTKCLVEKTSSADKTVLVQWIFAMVAVHPQVASVATVTPERRQQASRDAAVMLQKVLTETCLNETRSAAQYEGRNVFEPAFNQLGQVAARELFGDPAVTKAMGEFGQYVDMSAIARALEPVKK